MTRRPRSLPSRPSQSSFSGRSSQLVTCLRSLGRAPHGCFQRFRPFCHLLFPESLPAPHSAVGPWSPRAVTLGCTASEAAAPSQPLQALRPFLSRWASGPGSCRAAVFPPAGSSQSVRDPFWTLGQEMGGQEANTDPWWADSGVPSHARCRRAMGVLGLYAVLTGHKRGAKTERASGARFPPSVSTSGQLLSLC